MNFDDRDEPQYLQEMRLLIIGRTGRGKSASANTICGSQERNVPFLTGVSSSSITQNAKIAYREYTDRKLCVIDTAGLFDTDKSIEETMEQLTKGFQLAAPGPHAFLIVLYGRYTDEEQKVFDSLQRKFGQYFMDYCILIITHEDEIRDDDKQSSDNETIRKYFQAAPQTLKNLLVKCNNRCILINNRASFEKREEKVAVLVEMIKQNEQDRANSFYNEEMFDQAERYYREFYNDEFDHQKNEWNKNEEEIRQKVEQIEYRREARLRLDNDFVEFQRQLAKIIANDERRIIESHEKRTTRIATTTLNVILDKIKISSDQNKLH